MSIDVTSGCLCCHLGSPNGYSEFAEDLAGLKVRHGLDKVMEGAAVVLTLKDTNILVDGDLNDGIVLISTLALCFVLQFCQFLETG